MPAEVESFGITAFPVAVSDFAVTETEGGWDTAKQTYLVQASHLTRQTIADTHWPREQSHPIDTLMFIVDRRARDLGGGEYEFEITWKGITGDKGYIRKEKIYGETSTGERILIDAGLQALGYPALAEKLKIEQPILSVETTYFTTTEPVLTGVKKPVSGAVTPALPTPPTQVWGSISFPTYVYPAGWVLDDRQPDRLLSANLWRVTDRHIYRYMTEM